MRAVQMKDVRQHPIDVGDMVAYVQQGTSSGWMVTGYVIGFTPKMVRIGDSVGEFVTNRNPSNIAVLEKKAIDVQVTL